MLACLVARRKRFQMEGKSSQKNLSEKTARISVTVDEADSPLLSVANVTDSGLVLFSRQNFDVGSQLRMGLHVRLKNRGSAASRSHFVDVEGFVVNSCARTARGRTMFEVTLLFDQMSPEEVRLLASVPKGAIRARANRGISDYEAFLMGEKTRSVVGLN